MENKIYLPEIDVVSLPNCNALAAIQTSSHSVFKDSTRISPMRITDRVTIMPWGADNSMPFDILDKIEADETMSTCMEFNSEVCYGSGLVYHTKSCEPMVVKDIEKFFASNAVPNYWAGVCHDYKYFGFAVSLVILSKDRSKIASIHRKEAIYCRFGESDSSGRIKKLYYANWRKSGLSDKDIETIELLDERRPLDDLRERIARGDKNCKYAIVSKLPTIDSTYYPIPYYASLFRGNWYDIKKLIGIAKEAKLRNSAPIKYHIQVTQSYWDRLFEQKNATTLEEMRKCVNEQKQTFIDYLTGAENSGKVIFSEIQYNLDGKPVEDVKITKLETEVQGGDWSTDIQEAVNMICFVLRIHPNLLGAVPGKSQSNTSGSDKRELYTIAQALQKPSRDILFQVHWLIINFNRYEGAVPCCPIIQLTTLDEHRDVKETNIDLQNKNPRHDNF